MVQLWHNYFSFFQDAKAANGEALTETNKNYYERGNSKPINPDSYREATQKKWKRIGQNVLVIS